MFGASHQKGSPPLQLGWLDSKLSELPISTPTSSAEVTGMCLTLYMGAPHVSASTLLQPPYSHLLGDFSN